MSRENVELVTAIADAVNRRDLDALITMLDEGVEHCDALRSTRQRGREAIRRHFVDLWEESPNASFSVTETLDGGDWVVARQAWRGLEGGDLTTWVARRFVGGKVSRVEVYATRGEALEAVGMSE